MILDRSRSVVGFLLSSSVFVVGCGSNSQPKPLAVVNSAAVDPVADPSGVVVVGYVETHGSPKDLRFDVTFKAKSIGFLGNARIERPDESWPSDFEIRVRARNVGYSFVTLNPDGFDSLSFLNGPKESKVHFYDEHGRHVERPIENGLRIATEETADGLTMRVSLPEQARSMRGITMTYHAFSW